MKRLNFQKIILIILLININISQLLSSMIRSYFPISHNPFYYNNPDIENEKLDEKILYREAISQFDFDRIDNIKDNKKMDNLLFEFCEKRPEKIINYAFNWMLDDQINVSEYNQFYNICKFCKNSLSNIKKKKINIDHPDHNSMLDEDLTQNRELTEYKKLNKTLLEYNIYSYKEVTKTILINVIIIISLSVVFSSKFMNKYNLDFDENALDFWKNILLIECPDSHEISERINQQIYAQNFEKIEKILKIDESRATIIFRLKTILKDFFPNSKLYKIFKKENIIEYIEKHPLEILLNILLFSKDYNSVYIYHYHSKPFYFSGKYPPMKTDFGNKLDENLQHSVWIFNKLEENLNLLLQDVLCRNDMLEINEYKLLRISNFISQREFYTLFQQDKKKYKLLIESKYDMQLRSPYCMASIFNNERKIRQKMKNNPNAYYSLEKCWKQLPKDVKKCDKTGKIYRVLYQCIGKNY